MRFAGFRRNNIATWTDPLACRIVYMPVWVRRLIRMTQYALYASLWIDIRSKPRCGIVAGWLQSEFLSSGVNLRRCPPDDFGWRDVAYGAGTFRQCQWSRRARWQRSRRWWTWW